MGAVSSTITPQKQYGADELDVTRHVKRNHSPTSTRSTRTMSGNGGGYSPNNSLSSSPVEKPQRNPSAFGITGAFSTTVVFPARGNLDFHEDPDKFEVRGWGWEGTWGRGVPAVAALCVCVGLHSLNWPYAPTPPQLTPSNPPPANMHPKGSFWAQALSKIRLRRASLSEWGQG